MFTTSETSVPPRTPATDVCPVSCFNTHHAGGHLEDTLPWPPVNTPQPPPRCSPQLFALTACAHRNAPHSCLFSLECGGLKGYGGHLWPVGFGEFMDSCALPLLSPCLHANNSGSHSLRCLKSNLTGLSTSRLYGWTAGELILLLAFPSSLFRTPRLAFLLPKIICMNKLYAHQLLSQAVPPG